MSDYTVHTIESAAPKSKALLEKGQKAMGFVPNLYAVMAESPELLEAYQTLSGIFGKTSLSETERQVILMTNNRLNGCEYCMAAHTAISKMTKVPDNVIDALREGRPLEDAKLEALRVFAEKLNLSRGWPEENDVQDFLNAGYTQQNILEVVLGTGLKVLSNYTNHVTNTPLDDAFAQFEWHIEGQPVG